MAVTERPSGTGPVSRAGPVPPLEVEGPDGRRLRVAVRSLDDSVGELADAIAGHHTSARPPALAIDGVVVGRERPLATSGILRGSRVTAVDHLEGGTEPSPAATAIVTCVAGPGASTAVAVGPGRHVVGRARTAALRVEDDTVEPHHGILDVGVDGSLTFTQISGRIPCRVGGRALDGPTRLAPGTAVLLGASRLLVSAATAAGEPAGEPAPGASLGALAGDPWRRSLHRTPRARPRRDAEPLALPAVVAPGARAGGIGLVSAAIGAFGSLAMAVLLHQPMFVLFGALGLLAAGGTSIAGRFGAARAGRRAGARRDREVAAFVAAVDARCDAGRRFHDATTPTVSDALAAVSSLAASVWARRAGHDDAHAVVLGVGAVRLPITLGDGEVTPDLATILDRAERLTDVAVPTVLGPGAALAIVGAAGDAVVRSLVVQLATWTGPADWRLVVLADAPEDWDWCRWLPHAVVGSTTSVVDADLADAVAGVLARLDDGDPRHVVIVTDRPDLLAARTGSVRRFLGAAASAALVVRAASPETVPALCHQVVELGSLGVARWTLDTTTVGSPEPVHVAGISTATATSAARRLARLHDPEDPQTATSALASSVSLGVLAERHGVGPIDDPIAVAAAWRSGGRDPAPAAAIGITPDGVVELDLVRDGPHALVGGTTGSGKSELLRTMVVSLAARSSPDHLTFVLVDYKGGSTFDACAELPHTVGLVTDLDDRLAERALVSLGAELRRRERVLRDAGAADLAEYRDDANHGPLPRLVVVVDEFAALAAELPGFLSALVGIAQRGRSLGVHLVLATQRPGGVVSDEIRANTNLRVALRLHDPTEARDIVGDDAPAAFARGTPGRAMMRLGPGETVLFQSAHSSGPMAPRRDERVRIVAVERTAEPDGVSELTELTVLVRAIRHAAALCDIAPPHRPWLDPLPAVLGPAGLDGSPLHHGTVGLVDDPAGQCRHPLRWAPSTGNLVLLGARGSGTTTALGSLVVAATDGRAPDALHVYVIDAGGDRLLDVLEALPHCAGVVRLHETERLARLLRTLVSEVDRRRADPETRSGAPDVILAIDGLPVLRSALEDPATTSELAALARLLAEGPGAGLACAVTADRPGAVAPSMLAACGERWVFRLDDPLEGGVVGVPAAVVPRVGPGRLVVSSSGLEAQVAPLPVSPASAVEGHGGPAAIGVLPADVPAVALPRGRAVPPAAIELVVGLEFDGLAPACLVVPDGEHVLVAGPARSGRTTALVRLATSWREAHPDGVVRFLGARPDGPLGAVAIASVDELLLPPAGPRLVAVDDAERVDDPSGTLAALVAAHRPGLLVVAAGRPEALRPLYGTWTSIVRRSRLGLLLTACSETDGEVLGELLPRHRPLPARPGLAWLVASGERSLVQIAR